VLSDADIGSIFTVTASYTDDDGNSESEVSTATSAVAAIEQPFQFTYEIIDQSEVPNYGPNAVDANEKIIKLTLNADITRIADTYTGTTTYLDDDSSGIIEYDEKVEANEIANSGTAAGTEITIDSINTATLDFVINWDEIEVASYYGGATNFWYFTEKLDIWATDIFNNAQAIDIFFGVTHSDDSVDDTTKFNEIVYSVVDTDPEDIPNVVLVDNVDTTPAAPPNGVDHESSNDLFTLYLNPIDTITSLDLTYGGSVSINQATASIDQLDYTMTIDIV
jgi:hypothetical protein